jgi:hypothetical protein
MAVHKAASPRLRRRLPQQVERLGGPGIQRLCQNAARVPFPRDEAPRQHGTLQDLDQLWSPSLSLSPSPSLSLSLWEVEEAWWG